MNMGPDIENDDLGDLKVEDVHKHISARLNELARVKTAPDYIDKEVTLMNLEKLISKVGVRKEELNSLLDIVYEFEAPGLWKVSEKLYIVTNLLIPSQDNVLPTELIYRIISNTGIPQKYYKDGKVYKTNRLPIRLQTKILEWLVCSIHLFGPSVFTTLNRMLPILFNYLSYEYSRPYIANLIFLSISNSSNVVKLYYGRRLTHAINSFKPWHVQIVVDLLYKFPFDECLKALIALFKYLDPELDLSVYLKGTDASIFDFNLVSPSIFIYPNYNYLEKLKDLSIQRKGYASQQSSAIVKENFKRYESFNSSIKSNKRFKAARNAQDRGSLIFDSTSTGVSITDIHSMRELAESFHDIKHIDLSSTLSPKSHNNYLSEKYRRMCLVIQYLSGNRKDWRRLDATLKFTLLDDNMNMNDLNLLSTETGEFLMYGSGFFRLNSIDNFITSKIRPNPVFMKESDKVKNYSILEMKLDILQNLSYDEFTSSYDGILDDILSTLRQKWDNSVEKAHFQSCITKFFHGIKNYFLVHYTSLKENGGSEKIRTLLAVIGSCVQTINQFVSTNYKYIHTSGISAYFGLLRVIRSVPVEDIKENFPEISLIIPPQFVYGILFSKNPFFVSEICGYLAFCKNIHFDVEKYQSIQNSYLVDYLNFIWRDKAFTPSNMLKAFDSLLLTGTFIDSIRSSPIFNHSNFITTETIGNLFHDPCWSYITAQVVWEFEDKKSDLNVRHEGPISEESVARLNQSSDSIWLDKDYKSLKISILNKLDEIGYRGLGDLLFSSLTSLINQRSS